MGATEGTDGSFKTSLLLERIQKPFDTSLLGNVSVDCFVFPF
jgi:hypothetical protein